MIQSISESQKSLNSLSPNVKKFSTAFFISCLILMLWNFHAGYDTSLDWEVTTSADVISFPAWTMDNGLMKHEITSEKYLLTEQYSGSEIKRNLLSDKVYLAIIWLGMCLFLASATYLNRYLFIGIVAAFALMLNRLNLFEIGLFGIHSKAVILIPFIGLATPLILFHEYRKNTSFIIRLLTLLLISVGIIFGISNQALFIDHFLAHSIFSFGICFLLFLLIISEEVMFALLYVVTSGKGGKSNHIHFIVLSLGYIGNLTLYYLDKSGIYQNSFFIFDPFILLSISILVALWSLKFKNQLAETYMPAGWLPLLTVGIGIVSLGFVSLSMNRGMDAIYESMHYFILYFHIGFGFMFLLYIIANFIDPLLKGFEVYKIAYRERNFPYVTSKLGGLVIICAFYFYSGQAPYNLLRSGYYNYLSVKEANLDNPRLSKEYLIQASFLGYNTHYPNYQLGWLEWNEGKEFRSKTNFFNAAQRFPSPYALINYGNIDEDINPSKVQANYEEALRKMNSQEIKNNLGIILLEQGNAMNALDYFEGIESSQEWNDAPLLNKWAAYKKLELIDSTSIDEDYATGNFGVRANILTTVAKAGNLDFIPESLNQSAELHRQSYLLNSSYLFSHDSIAPLLRKEIDMTNEASRSDRLSKALALHNYAKGEVNQAFLIFDDLQANAHQYYKGEYLDDMGKLALDQGAYRLALDFFDKAIEVKFEKAQLHKLEAYATLDQIEDFKTELLNIVKKDPGLTQYANQLLDQLPNYRPTKQTYQLPDFSTLSDSAVISIGRRNAFLEEQVIKASRELNDRQTSGSYEMLIDALDINPYSIQLLKEYILVALDWNLIDYSMQSLERLKTLLSAEDYREFEDIFKEKRKAIQEAEW